ncbi:MAG: hypothetical protein IPM35_24125 [Myxococcales bacterium]|nr:hypothetical protein [Myxococcales bacterium]
MRGLLLAFALLSACGGAAKQPEPATPAPAPAPPGDDASSAEPTEAEPAVPRAKIVEVMPGKESADDRRVKISFHNPTTSSCTFTSYTLVWPGGRKTIEEKPFEIPAGGSRQRVLLMHPNDGDLAKLRPEGSEIEVNAGCSNAPQ